MARGDFAIVGEGITDQIVIKHVIWGVLDQWDDDPEVVFEQPPNDASATARELQRARERGEVPPGGWTLVIQYLEQRKYLQALQNNRYLVVQIDTDVAEAYGVRRAGRGAPLTDEALVEAVIQDLRGRIDPEVLAAHGHRFLFAVGVDEIECWLLGLVFDRARVTKLRKTTGCLEAANHERRRQKRSPLSDADGSHKDPAVYLELSRELLKAATLRRLAKSNAGLAAFVAQLERVEPPEGGA